MSVEYKGDQYIYAVSFESDGETFMRPFNQTDGSTNIEADTVELDTKDKTGSDYGKVSQTVSLEGIMTAEDPFLPAIKAAIRAKQFVQISEINTETLEAEVGTYMISSFEQTFTNGDFATYSLEAALNGLISVETLLSVPDGALGPDA